MYDAFSMELPLPFAFVLTLVGALAMVCLVVYLKSINVISPLLARKFMHISTGPVFILCWIVFPDDPYSPYLAASVPGLLTLYFVANGLGVAKNTHLTQAVSRTGSPSELLKGPMFYGAVHVIATIWYWRTSPIGMVSLITLCVGDGFADIVGRQYQSLGKLPWNPNKTVAGSMAFFLFSLLCTLPFVYMFITLGYLNSNLEMSDYVLHLPVVLTACTLVESLPFKDIDNITVFLCAAVIGHFLL